MEHKEMSGRRTSLQSRFAFSFAGLAILILVLVIGGIYHYVRSYLRDGLREQLVNMVGLAALQVDASQHAQIQSAASPPYELVRSQLQQIRDATLNVRYVYTLRPDAQDDLYFVVDADEDPDTAAPYGETYAGAGSVLKANFATMTDPLVEPDFYTDRWGTWLSGYAPLRLPDGRLEAVLAMDIAAEDIIARERTLLRIALIVLGVLVPVTFLSGWWLGRRLAAPIVMLTQGAQRIAEGDLSHRVAVGAFTEAAQLADAFNGMADQLQNLIQDLEHRVQVRSHDLERRAAYLEATGQVSRVAASILDVETLLEETVQLISEHFGFYHTGIFLVDESLTWAVLRAASSEGGQRMLARHHRLRVGEGIVGYTARLGRPRVAFDVGEDTAWVKNPDLPATRSEMALPLIVRHRVVGVLDVQSQEPEAFTSEDIATLRILADQVAVAIENARLFQESRRALQELREAQGQELQHGWASRMESALGYRYTLTGVSTVEPQGLPGLGKDQTQILERNLLAVPLKVGDTQFGALRIRRDLSRPWTSREIDFVQRVAQDIAQALENVRLLEDTRARAARESVLGEIGARMRETLDVDAVLQTALREIGETLGLAEVQVRMGAASAVDQLGEETK